MSQSSPLTPRGWGTAGVENNYWLMPPSSMQAEGGWAALRAEGVAGQCCRRAGFDPWVGTILWRRNWKSHGQRSLVGYSQWGRKESDTTDYLHTRHLSTYQHLPVCLSLHPPVYLNVRMTGVQEKPKGLKRTCFLPLARACRPGPARCQPSEKPGCV